MCRLSWNALEYTSLFLWGNTTNFLYNKQNNTWMLRNMKLFLVSNRKHSWSTLEISRPSGTNFCTRKRNIPVHWDEVKWNLERCLTRHNLQKRKQKETTFVGMLLIVETKLVFVLLTNYCQLFHAFLDEIDTSRTSRCTEIIIIIIY